MMFPHIVTGAFVFEYAYSINVLSNIMYTYDRNDMSDAFNEIVKQLHLLTNVRRVGDMTNLMNKKYLLNSLKKDEKVKLRQWLRQQEETHPRQDKPRIDFLEKVAESELKYALAKKTSALYDRPYVQKKGRQDYLVISPGELDPFVTVIPNDIYYNHEKTCVNWLEDCNSQGIRSRLLQKMKSPYM